MFCILEKISVTQIRGTQSIESNMSKLVIWDVLWRVCLQMFSSSRHRGFGGRKGGHVICSCNYIIYCNCFGYHIA
jgi:hypothetical protein